MKKLAVLAMAVVMLVCAMAIPAAAVTANGLWGEAPLFKGTITVDGKKDDIYEQGLKIATSAEPYNANNVSEASGLMYVLHDSKNLYVLVEVNNVYPITEYNPAYDGTKSWNTTCIEFFLDWSDKCTKAAEGYKYYARVDGGLFGTNMATTVDGITYKVTVDKTKNTYVAEFCFPFVGATAGSNIGIHYNVNADKTMGATSTCTRTIAGLIPGVGNDGSKWKSITLSTNEVKLPEATTKAPETTKAPAVVEPSVQTFDAAVVLAVVAAAAGAGVVVSKKRK